MARRKKEEKPEVQIIQNEPPQGPPAVEEPPEAFQKLAQTFAHKRNTRGRVGLYTPLFVPKGVKIAFRLAPSGLHGSTDYKGALYEGYQPVPPELVTEDEQEARATGKIALLTYDVVDGLVRVGEHVLMWMPEKEWFDRYYANLAEIDSLTNYARYGVAVSESASEPQDFELKKA